MRDAIIFNEEHVEKTNLMDVETEAAGWMKMIPAGGDLGSMMFGVSEIAPGYAGHRWHDHVYDEGKDFEVRYPDEFEEIYYILEGNGVVQWKDEAGVIKEKIVTVGDTIVFPSGIGQHQLYNNSEDMIKLVFSANKLPYVTIK
ncbi:cupin domain-containing protein [Acidaminobacter sp. JC074]|uniref:cupin domain-containing protein n=1 Tax=Acidaminobacter sp. JC074 TaxID=2530199 RepID=UPI001F10CAD5|nr:cupin domain-containing protein [Acidaminobacter sp. JC074]MCH4889227.1 cupin domain-containing protein [Acidaminobacter sp. JC074]